MLFCCLWRNVETFCHKHFVDVSREQQMMLLTTSGHGSAAACCRGCSIYSSQLSQILAQNRDFYLPHLHLTPPLMGFLSEYSQLATQWWKNFEDMFIRFDTTHECGRHTHTQTDTAWQHRPRLCIASHGKNQSYRLFTMIGHKTRDDEKNDEKLNLHFLGE